MLGSLWIQLDNVRLKDVTNGVREQIFGVLGILLLEPVEPLSLLEGALRVMVAGAQKLQGKGFVLQWYG